MTRNPFDASFDFTKSHNWISHFSSFPIESFEKALRTQGEDFWRRAGEERALKIFHRAATQIPAYKDFLKKNGVRHDRIKTIADFTHVPFTDKKNYTSKYSVSERAWNGDVSGLDLVAVSSGTSGEPKFWPRGGFQEYEAAVIHELAYRYLFEVHKYRTLMVIGFPMGIYVSGVATLLPSRLVSEKYNMTLATTGNFKPEAVRLVKYLQKEYDQVVLVGHPFFIKDVLETGADEGIRWNKKRLRMMFCSEGFNEAWRQYVVRSTKSPYVLESAINTYGSSELLLMGHETPLSIFTRLVAEKDPAFKKKLFMRAAVPNLFQYNPYMRYIESAGNDLIFTAASGIPMIRFNLKDSGILRSYEEVTTALDTSNPKWRAELRHKSATGSHWQLPFVALRGRSDYTMIFYAANIYPEHVHTGLNYEPFLRKLTGKFTMRKGYKRNMDEYLEINIELRPRVIPTKEFAQTIRARVITKLLEVNKEYADASSHLAQDLRPRIKLWPYQHKRYFRPGLKPRYISEV
ncbi:MAG: hypothetical protein AAB372_02120 [Patescibacteria group bacterium]